MALPGGPRKDNPHGLTHAERRVLRLLDEGRTVQEIALSSRMDVAAVVTTLRLARCKRWPSEDASDVVAG